MRALPNIETAGRMPRSRSVATVNSDIIPSTRHASCPLEEYSACGSIGSGIFSVKSHAYARAGRRVVVSLSRVPRAARSSHVEGRADRRAARRAGDVAPNGGGHQAGVLRRRVRRAGQDVPRRLVSRVQGEPRGDARRPRAADRAAARARARARLAAADGRRRRGRRRDRHAREAREARRHRHADLDLRQGHGAARRAGHHAASTR